MRVCVVVAAAAALAGLSAAPAHAGLIGGAIGFIFGGITGAYTAGLAGLGFLGMVGKRLLAVALTSLLQKATRRKMPAQGIRTEQTMQGERLAQTFVLGTYATGGAEIAPSYSHGSINQYLTDIIALADLPGHALEKVFINGEEVTFDFGVAPDPTYGAPATGRLAGECWIKVKDGSQTAADPSLLSLYGSYPDRPWTADMILRGVTYVILTCKFDSKLWAGRPACRFAVSGIAIYDPRLDTTVGGSGPQRWADPSTWTRSANPAVMIYNIMRGISIPLGEVWGGGVAAEDLPVANWMAAMNACDAAVALAAGGSEPAFRAGFEVATDMEPADVIEELAKACNAQLSDIGGLWKIRVGAPGLPVATFIDDDEIVTSPGEATPFPRLDSTFNGIRAVYPEPAQQWEAKDAPALYDAAWEAQDGNRRLVADVDLPAVPFALQVQRLMRSLIREERRFRRHALPLPPWLAHLEPLDAAAWTSARWGYAARVFEIGQVAEDLESFVAQVAIRERDAADFGWSTADELPVQAVAPTLVLPATLVLPGFTATGTSISDGILARRPAIRLAWTGGDLDGVRGVRWELRLAATGAVILRGTTQNAQAGEAFLVEGLVASANYEARAEPITDAPSGWTAWTAVATPAVRFGAPDLAVSAVTRPIIADGAVSDVWQAVVLGPFQLPSGSSAVRASLSLGAIPYGSLYRRGVTFDARHTSGFSFEVVLQRRYMFAAVWSAWSDLEVFSIPGFSGWDNYAAGGSLSGAYDAYAYRLFTRATGGSLPGTDVLKNIYITVADVKK